MVQGLDEFGTFLFCSTRLSYRCFHTELDLNQRPQDLGSNRTLRHCTTLVSCTGNGRLRYIRACFQTTGLESEVTVSYATVHLFVFDRPGKERERCFSPAEVTVPYATGHALWYSYMSDRWQELFLGMVKKIGKDMFLRISLRTVCVLGIDAGLTGGGGG